MLEIYESELLIPINGGVKAKNKIRDTDTKANVFDFLLIIMLSSIKSIAIYFF